MSEELKEADAGTRPGDGRREGGDRQTDRRPDRQAGRRSVEKELWQERTRPEGHRPLRTEEERLVRSGDAEEGEKPEIPEDACVRLYVCGGDK